GRGARQLVRLWWAELGHHPAALERLMTNREEIAELVALVDRLERLLERSGLSELELEVGGTTLVLRTPAAVASTVAALAVPGAIPEAAALEPMPLIDEPVQERGAHVISAPLTGVFYRSPSPDAEPYVREGGQVNAGQVIGLIEAMKLFNEIKSDVTGTVRHMAAGDGDLVKGGQTLIEVDPT
ncbi:MAG: acetyl-CoA carboxylase, partial [Chloroflexota bacterium]|nr:acetyl-CoA carboxylase [Chloroflexota bacterium]